MRSTDSFHVADYVVFVGSLVISLGIGIYYAFAGGKQKTTKEYLMGDRNMKLLPVSVSIMVSYISAILILGNPAEIYTRGTQYLMANIGTTLATTFATLMFVPLLYDLRLTSSYEYLELRFKSRAAKLTGTGISIVNMIFYSGIAAYAPSTALDAVTGFPTWASILTIGVVATIYTTLGGIKAVVWTDFFQCGVMIAGLLALVIQGSISAGGISKVWDVLGDTDRIEFFNFDPDPRVRHTFWGLTIGVCITWLGTFGVNQTSVQRYGALPTKRQAQVAMFLNIPFYLFMQITTGVAGMVIFAHYHLEGCDPLKNKDIDNANQLVPKFVLDVLGYPAVPGIFVASIYSGALSSVSSALSSLSAVTWQDILKPHSAKLRNLPEGKQAIVTKVLVAVYGILGISFAFVAMQFGGTVLQASLTFTGAAGGPLLGIFLLGSLFPFANWIGCVLGGISGLGIAVWVGAGGYTLDIPSTYLYTVTDNCTANALSANVTSLLSTTIATSRAPADITPLQELYTLSYTWIPTLAVVSTLVIGLLASCITGCMGKDKVDPAYLIDLRDTFCCCLPTPSRKDQKLSDRKGRDGPLTARPDDVELKERL